MGIPFSKSPTSPTETENNRNVAITTTTIEYTSELTSYESACHQDPSLQSFDTSLQQKTSHVISSLATDINVHSLSFDTLREVTGCLLDLNQDVVKTILEVKKDIWKNPELFNIVEDYFDNSLRTLDFCTSLDKCLNKARESQLVILVALKLFKEEEKEEENNRKKYERTMEELKHFKAIGDPFTEEFFRVFHLVYEQQVSMLEKLQKKKRKIDRKLKTMEAWRKVSSVIFVSIFASVLIFSVVAAAITAPPIVTALVASAGVAMGPIDKWLNSLWKNYLDALKGRQELLDTVQVRTYVTISDLDSIRVLVHKLESQISTLLQNVNFAHKEEEAARFVIEEIKKKLEVFTKSVEDLAKQADRCSRDVRKARTVVLQRIIRHPN